MGEHTFFPTPAASLALPVYFNFVSEGNAIAGRFFLGLKRDIIIRRGFTKTTANDLIPPYRVGLI